MRNNYLLFILLFFLFSCERNPDTEDLLVKFYGDAFEDIGYAVTKTENGYFISGQFTDIIREITTSGSYINGSAKKMVIIKTNDEGSIEGKPFIPGGGLTGCGSKMVTLDDGSVIAVGFVTNPGTEKDIHLVKINPDGSVDTEKTYKRNGNQTATDIISTNSGFLILGTTDQRRGGSAETGNTAGKKDILFYRLNTDLDTVTSIPAVGFIGNDEGVAIKADVNGGYVVVGTTDRSDRPASEQSMNNIIILKINDDGKITEPRILGGLKNESASDFEVLSNGYLIAGTTGSEGIDQQGYIWKIPLNIYSAPEFENPINSISFDPGSTTEVSFSVKAMCYYKPGSYLLAGQYGTGLSSQALIFSIDADAMGSPVTGCTKIIGGTGAQAANDITCDDEGNIVAVGSNSYENNSMIIFLKFRF